MANVSVYNMEGKEVGTIELNDAVFGVEVNEHLVHMAVVQKVIRMIAHEVNNTTAGITSTLDTVDGALEYMEDTEDLREVMKVCIERCYSMYS